MSLAALARMSDFNVVPVDDVKNAAPVKAYPEKAKLDIQDPMAVPARDRRKAMERLEFCRLAMSVKKESGKGLKEACEIVSVKYCEKFPLLLNGGKKGHSQLTYNNCRHWLRLLDKKGNGKSDWENLSALCNNYARGPRKTRGNEGFWQLFYAFYLNRNQLSVSEAHRLAASKTRRENPFAVIPKEYQCRYQVKKLDTAAVLLARHGEEALKNNFIDYIRRDWDEIEAGRLWVSDHRQFDVAVRTWDEEKKCWKAVRPWICGMMDARSWYIPGYIITVDNPNCASIQDALAMGIYQNDMCTPDYVYADNGKDFQARGFSSPVEIGEHKHSIYRELGITAVTSLAYNAKAKTIERMFGNVSGQFDKWFAAYLGNRPSERPDVAQYFYKNPEDLPSLEQFCQVWKGWLEQYHATEKNGKIHKGKSPEEIWKERKTTKRKLTIESLKFALLKPVQSLRKVHRGPAVSLDNKEYFSDKLWPYLDKKILLKTDRYDDEHVYAFETDGRLICECRTRKKIKALAIGDEAGRKEISESMKRQRQQMKSCYTYINDLTGREHLVSPMEIFLSEEKGEVVKGGEIKSVKGASHRFKHYKLENGKNGTDNLLMSPGEEKEEKLKDFARSLDKEEEEPEGIDSQVMSNFHKMIIDNKRRKNDEQHEDSWSGDW